MAAQQTSRQLVVFSLGEEEYALAIEHVHEIIRYVEPRAVATGDTSVRGVISLRGKIVPVLDLSERLNVVPATAEQDRRIVVVTDADEMIGVTVDAVTEVITVELSAFADAPLADAHHIASVVQLDDRLLVVLDPARLAGTSPAETESDESQAVA